MNERKQKRKDECRRRTTFIEAVASQGGFMLPEFNIKVSADVKLDTISRCSSISLYNHIKTFLVYKRFGVNHNLVIAYRRFGIDSRLCSGGDKA